MLCLRIAEFESFKLLIMDATADFSNAAPSSVSDHAEADEMNSDPECSSAAQACTTALTLSTGHSA